MLQKKLGQRIADLRKNRQLTQVQLAKAVGCSVEFISLVERGVNAPSVARLEDFAKALKVEVVNLFTFERRKPIADGVTNVSSAAARLLRPFDITVAVRDNAIG